MKRFVEIEYHDFMDLKPTTEVRVFEGTDEETLEKNVNDYVAHMQEHWCSGTTRLIGIMEQSDALAYLDQQIAQEHANWQEDSQEFIDKICGLFKDCYGTDAVVAKCCEPVLSLSDFDMLENGTVNDEENF